MNKGTLLFVVMLFMGTATWAQNTQPQDSAQAQPQDTTWKVSGAFGFKFNQVALTNWAAGGQNSLAWNTTFDFKANYKKDKWKWDNLLHLGYGLSKQGDDPLNKTDDQILFTSNVGYDLKGPWFASFNVNFRTQFTDGFNLPNDSVKVSTFMAPAYLVASIGVGYKPHDDFVFMVNPISSKTIFVLDDFLSAQGAFGVDTLQNIKEKMGAFVSLYYKKEIVKNVTFNTLYTMYGNYKDLQAWDINWDIILDFKINDFLSANFTTNLIYDQDVKIPVDTNDDGVKDGFGPRVQFRQALGIGLIAKFKSSTVK